jgi:hypothetical protein
VFLFSSDAIAVVDNEIEVLSRTHGLAGWLRAKTWPYCIETSAGECLFVLVAPIEEALSQCSKMSFLASYQKQGRRRRHCMCARRANTPLRRQQVSAQCSSHGAQRDENNNKSREKEHKRSKEKRENTFCIFELHISFLYLSAAATEDFVLERERHSNVIDS